MEGQHTPPLGVFWDIENCQVPSGKSALSVCDKIRQQSFCLKHSERQFAVVCDVTKENRQVLEELDKAQVDIYHVPANRKNAVDFKIKTLMRRFADTHRDGARIVLISGDSDFAGDIADFKRRMCLSVILLHTNQCSESLKLAATSVYNFQNLMSCIEIRQDLLRLQCPQVSAGSVGGVMTRALCDSIVVRSMINSRSPTCPTPPTAAGRRSAPSSPSWQLPMAAA